MILDTNVVIDLLDGSGSESFTDRIADLQAAQGAHVNEIIFAELAGRFESAGQAEAFLERMTISLARLSLEECHRAGLAFREYRKSGGARTTILPDFLIGAQATVRGWPLVTCDRTGYARYFPELTLIDPTKPDE